MNIGLCYPHPEEGRKIFKQFLGIEPAQRSAARQLAYKMMGGMFFYEGRLCISQAMAIKLLLATLAPFRYIFVRDLSILRQLTLMSWPDSPEARILNIGYRWQFPICLPLIKI
jgi:hypothetical protein